MAEYTGITDGDNAPYTKLARWEHMIFGSWACGSHEMLVAVNWAPWQQLRMRMKGASMLDRHRWCEEFLKEQNFSQRAKMVITNYIGALKRGGMLHE